MLLLWTHRQAEQGAEIRITCLCVAEEAPPRTRSQCYSNKAEKGSWASVVKGACMWQQVSCIGLNGKTRSTEHSGIESSL